MHDPRYAERRIEIEARFAEMNAVEATVERHVAPSGRYSLEIAEYTLGPASWNYSRGIVRDVASGDVIADVKRNYGMFWFTWVARDEREYLLCGEDYQGYNVVDLVAKKNVLTFPAEAFSGGGFCWAVVYPSPTGRTLAVEGCYWACPYELVFYDFTNPLQSPLPELARVQDLEQVEGWRGEHEFGYTAGEQVAIRSVWRRENHREA